MPTQSRRSFAILAVVLTAMTTTVLHAQPSETDEGAVDRKVEALFAQLTLKEKISLMAGASMFQTHAIERLHIPALRFSDGPAGVRLNRGDPATAFPTGVGMAATWNTDVVGEVAAAIGREARAKDVQVMLGPDVNIQRTPLAGRNFEAFSEDPYLTGRLGIAHVQGMQSTGVGTSVKHFVANEQETDRNRSSSNVDERTLREIYLRPFEMIVKQAHPWTVMASYNRLNGVYMSENRALLHDVLKTEWGYDGLVMSDWFAVQTTVEAGRSGLDLEMPGPPMFFGERLEHAVRNYFVDEADIDAAAKRVLRLVVRSGLLDKTADAAPKVDPAKQRQVARQAAEESITLLKNEHALLPFDASKIKTLAVIGPNADVAMIQGGGSSHVIASKIETPLDALHSLLDGRVQVTYSQGVDNDSEIPTVNPRFLSASQDRKTRGLTLSYFGNAGFQGAAIAKLIDANLEKFGFGDEMVGPRQQFSARWEGYLWPNVSGMYELGFAQSGQVSLTVDGKKLITPDTPTQPIPGDFTLVRKQSIRIELTAGRGYPIRIDYVSNPLEFNFFRFGVRPPPGTVEAAVKTARAADAAILFVGSAASTETEALDRANMALPGQQNELVAAVLAANPNTVVVLNNGAPLELPWIDKAPAVLEAWFPGQEGNAALADVICGKVNPSGKLPVTFAKHLRDNPTYLYFAGGREATYGEGVFVGYRYYDKKDVAPLFPFGHGLSYTQFEYGDATLPNEMKPGQAFKVSVQVRNTGTRTGAETVQLYVGDATERHDVVRPVRELKAFKKIVLKAGEQQTLSVNLTTDDLAYYDAHAHAWRSPVGRYRVSIGSSSRDIRTSAEFTLPQTVVAGD